MRYHILYRYMGFILLLNALGLLVSALVSLVYQDEALTLLLYSAMVAGIFGIFPMIFVPSPKQISNNEGLIILVGSWLLSCLLGMLPYLLWGGEFTFTNAWFESVSGFTTTGSTILSDIESLPRGLLFWRALTHWLGGMGIIVLALSIMPAMGAGMKVLYQSEMSTLALDDFQNRTKSSVRILAKVYVGLTGLEVAALMFCGMDWFDALTHSFATIATGGFSTRNLSIASFDSVLIEVVIMFFMIVSGVHFAMLFAAISGQAKNLWRSPFFRYYLTALAIGILLSAVDLNIHKYSGFWEALRFGSFQLLSVGTSTGFASADSAIWSPFTQLLLIFFSLQCACAGSTSGGIKANRIVIMGKAFIRQMKQLQHPHAVIPFTIGRRTIDRDVFENSVLYVVLYITVVFIATLLLVATGTGFLEAFTGSVATMGNVGPGLGSIGSLGNFDGITTAGKWILSLTMLLGRLEIYALVMFFIPKHWKTYASF